jgi:hypothetical protein
MNHGIECKNAVRDHAGCWREASIKADFPTKQSVHGIGCDLVYKLNK